MTQNERINIRLTQEQKILIKERAASQEMSVTEYILHVLGV